MVSRKIYNEFLILSFDFILYKYQINIVNVLYVSKRTCECTKLIQINSSVLFTLVKTITVHNLYSLLSNIIDTYIYKI